MPQKTVTIAGQDYTLAPITAGEAKALKDKSGDVHEFNMALVAASLRSAGAQTTFEDVTNMPYFSTYLPLQQATLEVNGLAAEGEAPAAPEPAAADSTSETSTAQ